MYKQRAHSREAKPRRKSPGLLSQTKHITPPPGANPDALPVGPKANPGDWLSKSRELQAMRGGDRLIYEDVLQAISDAKEHCGHCGGKGH